MHTFKKTTAVILTPVIQPGTKLELSLVRKIRD
jgi:hypothetical protein